MAEKKGIILIADGEKASRKALHKRLKSEDYHCEQARNADEALTCLENSSTDLVLLDINMAGDSGMELLTRIKERHHSVVVIMTAGTNKTDTAILSLRQGAYDYITKPFNLDEVVHSVKRAMERRRLELELQDYQQLLEHKLEEQAKEFRETILGVLSAISSALEAKDGYIAGHSHRVTEIALAIGKKLALEEDELEDLRWGSLLRDIGMIAVDRIIVNKPGKLNAEEYEHVMTHPAVGASIVEPVVKNKRIIEVIEHHHARYDGNIFNQKLKGEEIPLLARIVALADAYDAMTSTRSYRAAWSREQALAEIRWEIGKQFDPLVANAFLEISAADIMPEPRKILVADDEENIRLIARNALSNNFTVIEATDGYEAIEAARNQQPAIILMDVRMPKKDGLQAYYEIKTDLSTKAIPVVMLTAMSQEMERKLIAKLGTSEYLTKPFSPESLLEVVNNCLANDSIEKHETSSVAAGK